MVTNIPTQDRSNRDTVRSIGFPKSIAKPDAPTAAPAPKSAPSVATHRPPTPKRPKGKLFITLVLFSIMASSAAMLWNELLRFQAYGSVRGHVLRVATPWQGTIRQLYVEDGDRVEKGTLLASLESLEMEMKLSKIQSELEMARATMATRLAELSNKQQEHALENLRTQVDYFQILGQFHSESAKLQELETSTKAVQPLNGSGVISQVELDQMKSQRDGQSSKVASLKQAVEELKEGMSKLNLSQVDSQLLLADQSRVNSLMDEWEKWSEYRKQGEIRSPVAGRIIQRKRLAGEYVDTGSELFDILEEGSLEAHVLVTQTQAAGFKPGDEIELDVPPHQHRMRFAVDRLDDETTTAPEHITRYYQRGARLVSLIAKPITGSQLDTQGNDAVWLGAEVRLPRIPSLFSGDRHQAESLTSPKKDARAFADSLPHSTNIHSDSALLDASEKE